MTPLLVGAVAASLLGSPHCVGMCGPLVAATGAAAPAWHAGRLATYGALGVAAGALGSPSLFGGTVVTVVSAALLIAFAARLAGWAPPFQPRLPGLVRFGARLLRKGGVLAHFGFGVVSGLLPCGLVWSALALAVAAGSAVAGAEVLACFWLGTLPALSVAAVALRRLAAARPWTRKVVAGTVLAAGLLSIAARTAPAGDAPSCHEPTGP